MNKIHEIWNGLSLKETIDLGKKFDVNTMEAIWKNKKLVEHLLALPKKSRLIGR